MKIQLETRTVVIGVVAVISVVAILGLAQTPTPTPTCTPSSEKLQFQLVLKCVQDKDYPNLYPTLKKELCSHKNICHDNSTDGTLTICGDQDTAWCKTDTKMTSNVTQRVAFIKKEDLDHFMSTAFSTSTPTPTP